MGFQLSPLKSWTWWWFGISFPRQSTTSWWDGGEAGGGRWLFCLRRVFLPVPVRRRRTSRLSQRKLWRNSRRKRRKLQRRLRNRPKWSVVVFFFSTVLWCFTSLKQLWRAVMAALWAQRGWYGGRGEAKCPLFKYSCLFCCLCPLKVLFSPWMSS